MSLLKEVGDILNDAKKLYDKEKYISILEEQVIKLQRELERLETENKLLSDSKFAMNKDHLEIFNIFGSHNYKYSEQEIRNYVSNNIDLEIALSELIDNKYIEYPSVSIIGGCVYLVIKDSKRIEFLRAIKKES